ncbi:MAG: TetR/AcrR family transcriptional regulator [Erythrobacter sp.]|nr:TetR/AcrR family transcriptional regulator [Erythrobacter sp.]
METTTKPAPSKKEMRRAAILDAAERLVIETGGEFEISQLAQAAEISNGLAYHYFGSKDGVVEAVIDRFYERYSAVMDKKADPEISWPVRERARLLETIAFLYSDPFAPVAFGALGHPRAIQKEHEVQREMMENAAHNVRSGQRRGQIPTEIDSALAGAAIIGAIRSTMMMAMRMNPRPDPDKVADQIWQLIEGAVSLRS